IPARPPLRPAGYPFVTSKRFFHAIWLVGFLALNVFPAARAMPAPADSGSALLMENVAPRMRLAQAKTPATPDAATVPDQQSAPEEPIGNVATLTGVATVTRNNTDTPLQLKDDIYLNDIVKTQASSSLSITFNDATTFRLSANAEVTIDNYVYEQGGAGNAGTFDIARGTVAFVAAQVAKTGKMEITTPTATMGIRGTTGVVDVPAGVTATSANNVNIKLYPDADGRGGRALRRGADCDLAATARARPGFCAPGSFRAECRPADRDRAARLPPRQSGPDQSQRAAAARRPAAAGPEPSGSAGPKPSGPAAATRRAQQPSGSAAAGTARAIAARGPDRPAGNSRATGHGSPGPERVARKPGATRRGPTSRSKRTARQSSTARCTTAPGSERTADQSGAARRCAAARPTTGTTKPAA